jgi:guanine deaminase
MLTEKQEYFLEQAVALSRNGMEAGNGGPFGCIITMEDEIIGKGFNAVTSLNDPTAHAEIMAIREACQKLGNFQLIGCEMFSSCEPCPMCLGAIYWARPKLVVYANSKDDASAIGFDDAFIYKEIRGNSQERKIPFIHFPIESAKKVFADWVNWNGKKPY